MLPTITAKKGFVIRDKIDGYYYSGKWPHDNMRSLTELQKGNAKLRIFQNKKQAEGVIWKLANPKNWEKDQRDNANIERYEVVQVVEEIRFA